MLSFFLELDFSKPIYIGVGSGGSGGALAPPACKKTKFRAIFVFSGNLSKCFYILPEKFVTAITSPKKKKGHHLFGLTFGDMFRPKMMEKVQRNRR